jgi:protein-glucosylgalactosylhydroxylysine glucosidase
VLLFCCVDASISTTALVLTLTKAAAMAKAAGREPGANWTDIADKIHIQFDKQKQYHPEYDGFEPGVVAPRNEWNGGHGASKVKQADAILIGFPYDMNMSNEVRKNDLTIYENCTDTTSVAMTWGMFAVGWLDAGEQSKAEATFKRGYANIKPPFGVWTETPTGGTVNFITGAGGFLQAVVFGYGGLRLREGRLDIKVPPLPAGTDALTLNGLHYRGSKLKIAITLTKVSVHVLENPAGLVEGKGERGGGGGGMGELDLCSGIGGARPLTIGKVFEIGRSEAASIRPSSTCGARLP